MHDNDTTPESAERATPVDAAAERSPGLRFSLRSLLVATMVICILLAVLVPSLRQLRRASHQMQCRNNMKQIALSLLNYHDVWRQFPWAVTYADDGTPMHSWRVRILSFVEARSVLYGYDFREPWNGPTNCLFCGGTPVTGQDRNRSPYPSVPCPPLYRCPSAPRSQDPTCTNYVMLIDDRPGQPNAPPHLPGSVALDAHSDTAVMIIEIADSDIHWMEPRDMLLSELSMKINDRTRRSLSSYHGGACIAHADGTVEVLDDTTTAEQLERLLTQWATL